MIEKQEYECACKKNKIYGTVMLVGHSAPDFFFAHPYKSLQNTTGYIIAKLIIQNGLMKRNVLLLIITAFALAPAMHLTHADSWMETTGVAFSQPMQQQEQLAYNVTAVAQSDNDGIGPAYLINALSNAGYWYQIGLSYNWSIEGNASQLSHADGFLVNYNVFNPNGTVVAPVCPGGPCGGVMNITGNINNGDKILLSISVQGSNIIMSMKDWNTGAAAEMNFSNEGATGFEGTLRSPNYAGFFSGLMTEWHHNAPYYYQNGTPAYYQEYKETYSPSGQMPTSGWLFLFKICTSPGCLSSSSDIGYIVADRQASGDVITYTPENTTDLTQQDLPYSFNSYDGQAAAFYQNGTFQTGLLQPKTITAMPTSSTSSTSTQTSTSTLPTTTTVHISTTTTTVVAGHQNLTKSENVTGTSSPAGSKHAGTSNNVAILIGLFAILVALAILIRKRPKPPSKANVAQQPDDGTSKV